MDITESAIMFFYNCIHGNSVQQDGFINAIDRGPFSYQCKIEVHQCKIEIH